MRPWKAPDHTFASAAQIADFDTLIDVRFPVVRWGQPDTDVFVRS